MVIKAIYVLWLREVKRFFRAKSRIVSSLIMPLFFLIAMGFGFSRMAVPGLKGNYILFLLPGIIGMSIMNTSLLSGISVLWDREFGFLKEIMVAPVKRVSITLGRVAGGITTSLIQATLLFILSIALGLKATFFSVLIGFLLMILISSAFVGLGLVFASLMKDLQGFSSMMGLIIMPLLFLSGAFYPVNNLPIYVRIFSYIDPLTYGVDALRFVFVNYSVFPIFIDLAVLFSSSLFFIILGTFLFKEGV